MPYVTFRQDMRTEGKKMLGVCKDMGAVVKRHISDPFAMFWPLCKTIGRLMICCAKMAEYVLRKIWD